VSRAALVCGLSEVHFWIGISDRVRIDCGVHSVHMATAAGSPGSGGDAHLRESCGGGGAGMAARVRTIDGARGYCLGGDSRGDYADPPGRTQNRATGRVSRASKGEVFGAGCVTSSEWVSALADVSLVFRTHGAPL